MVRVGGGTKGTEEGTDHRVALDAGAQGRWFVKRDRTVWVDKFCEKYEISA